MVSWQDRFNIPYTQSRYCVGKSSSAQFEHYLQLLYSINKTAF